MGSRYEITRVVAAIPKTIVPRAVLWPTKPEGDSLLSRSGKTIENFLIPVG